MSARGQDARPETMVPLRPAADGPRLVILPDLTGTLLYARMLIAALPESVSCEGMRLGPETLQSLPEQTLPGLGQQFAADLLRTGIDRPLHLAGYSFAGLLAFETARALAEAGTPPARVWLFDTVVCRWNGGRDPLTALLTAPVAEAFLGLLFLKIIWRDVLRRHRDPDILFGYGLLRMDLKTYPAAYRDIIRGLYGALDRYRPRAWPGGAVTLFRAADERHRWAMAPDLGWRRLVGNGLRMVEVPGTHDSILKSPQIVRTVATVMQREMAAALEGRP